MQTPTIILKAEDLTTALEAAKYLGVHFTTVYRWMKDGMLHPIPIAGQRYLSIDEVKFLKKKREVKQSKAMFREEQLLSLKLKKRERTKVASP